MDGKIVVRDESRDDSGNRRSFPFSSYNVKIFREYDDDRKSNLLNTITVSPYIYTVVMIAYVLLNLVGIAVAYTYGELTTGFSWGIMLVVCQFLYFVASFTVVKTNDLGGLTFFGRIVREVDSGLFFSPIGLFELVTLPKQPVQEQFPGDPEKVFKKGDKEFFSLTDEQRKGIVLPIRVLTGGGSSGDAKNSEEAILNSQMTLEVSAYVRIGIEQFWVFFIRMGNYGEAIRQLRDSIERVLTEEVAKRPPRQVVAEIRDINGTLTNFLEEVTEDWGVRIYEAAMLSPDLTHSVNSSLQDIVIKKAEAVQTKVGAEAEALAIRTKADADQHRLTAEGQGAANAKKAELVALAEGAKELGVDGQALVDLEKTRAIASGKTTVFIDGGGQNGAGSILGLGARLAAGAAEGLKANKPEEKKE